MSDRYKGAILSPTAPTVTPQSAGGIYTSSQQLQYQGQGVWPQAVNNPINNSLRFRASASAYLNRTPASAGNRQIWTWSGWVKLGLLSPSSGWNAIFGAYSDDNNRTFFYTNNSSVSNTFYIFDVSGGSTTSNLISTQVLRDVSAWYHLVVAVDTTQATSSNRIKVYLNGAQITAFGTATYPSQNTNFMVNNNVVHYIGASSFSGINLFHDGYMTEINFVNAVQLTPSSFGTTDAYGIWQPIPYTGAYGTNGFYLPFTDNSALTTSSNVGLGKDFSGNGNYWVTNNISITAGSTYDSMKDVPTNTNSNTANYFVLNPLVPGTSSVLSNGNLTFTNSAGTGNQCIASMFVTSGSYYFEATLTTAGGGGTSQYVLVGDGNTSYSTNGQIYSGGVLQTTVATLTSGDVVGLAFTPSGSVTYYKNGASVYTGGVGGGIPLVNGFSGTVWNVNFGQRPFAYTPPSGFYPLNTYNLPTPTILDGDQYMDATLYTATTGTNTIVNAGGFQPDFVWIKSRSNPQNHYLVDSVRGGTSLLRSNTTDAESIYSTPAWIISFNSNGFTSSTDSLLTTGYTYVGWQWRASNAAGVSNTQGTITSTVSANTTAGFSIVTYTGVGGSGTTTVGHGLGVAPSMVIIKRRNSTADWATYHTGLTSTSYYLFLNSTAGQANYGSTFISPSSSTLTIDAGSSLLNTSTGTYVAYCFSAVAGYSAFGSYTGNGSTDGPFIFTGFRPRFLMIKRTSGTPANWYMWDSSRSPFNAAVAELYPNLSNAEANGSNDFDFLSNGFKTRNTADAGINGSGETFIYMAFAENPFKIARGR